MCVEMWNASLLRMYVCMYQMSDSWSDGWIGRSFYHVADIFFLFLFSFFSIFTFSFIRWNIFHKFTPYHIKTLLSFSYFFYYVYFFFPPIIHNTHTQHIRTRARARKRVPGLFLPTDRPLLQPRISVDIVDDEEPLNPEILCPAINAA